MFELALPVILAPMGAVAGGELAAAVSNAGGLGLIGGGYGDAQWLQREIDAGRLLVSGRQESGQGGVLITADIDPAAVEGLIPHGPSQIPGPGPPQRVRLNPRRGAPGPCDPQPPPHARRE